jgi:hypothetical protein
MDFQKGRHLYDIRQTEGIPPLETGFTIPATMNPIATIARKSGRPENSVKGGGLGYK